MNPPKLDEHASSALRDFIMENRFDPTDLDRPQADFALTPLMRAAWLGRGELAAELLARVASTSRHATVTVTTRSGWPAYRTTVRWYST